MSVRSFSDPRASAHSLGRTPDSGSPHFFPSSALGMHELNLPPDGALSSPSVCPGGKGASALFCLNSLLSIALFLKMFLLWHWAFVVAYRIFSCSMWDLVPWPGITPRPPALGAQNLCHWITRQVPLLWFLLPTGSSWKDNWQKVHEAQFCH